MSKGFFQLKLNRIKAKIKAGEDPAVDLDKSENMFRVNARLISKDFG